MILRIFDMFPIFMELTLRRQKTLFLSFYVSGTQTTSKWPANLRASNIWKEQDRGAKEANKRRPEGPDEWAHAAHVPGRMGPPLLGLGALLPSIFPPPTPFWPKTDYKNSPRCPSERSAAETQKHRNRDLELQIGGGKLRRGAAGVVSIFSNDFSTISMMKRE